MRRVDGWLRRERTLRACEALSATAHLVSGLEHLMSVRSWAGELDDPSTFTAVGPSWLRRPLELAARPSVRRVMHCGRMVAAAALLAPTPPRVRLAADAYLAAAVALLEPSHRPSMDGADTASFVVQAAATVARVGRGPEITDACLWFIAGQSALSYGAAGLAKTLGPNWRNGLAPQHVLRTIGYGDRHLWRLMTRYPALSTIAGRAVLAMECGFPLVLTRPGRRYAPALVAAAATFHMVNARVMGLNRFAPACLAMHPAVLYVAGPRRRTGPGAVPETRDDLMPAMMGATGLALAAGTVAANRRRRRQVTAGRDTERELITASGNVLRYRQFGVAGPDRPLVVLEAGLGGIADHWEWVARGLGQRFPVLMYHRAGYGGSRDGGRSSNLDIAVNDLVELSTARADGRPVVLAGFLLGGYLARHAAARMPGQVCALALVDPSDPVEVDATAAAVQLADHVDRQYAGTIRWLRLGLGAAKSSPPWLNDLPADVRALANAQAHDVRTYVAARREWRAFRDHAVRVPMPPLSAPTLVLMSRKTTDDHRDLHARYKAIADAAPEHELQVIEGSAHDSILVHRTPARAVYTHIIRLLDRVTSPAEVRGVTHAD